MKQFIHLVSAFILGVSIIIAAFIIMDSPSNSTMSGTNKLSVTSISIPDLMNKKQLSEYLQVSEQAIDDMIKNDGIKKVELHNSYDTYQFLPYLKIDNQERFLKSEVDQWLKYKNDNHES